MTDRKYSQYFLSTTIPLYGLKIGVQMATYILSMMTPIDRRV